MNEDDVRQLVSVPLCIEAVEEAHRELSLGSAIDVPRQRTRLPQTALHILQGALPGRDAIGYKAYTSNRSGVRFLVYVFSAASGVLRAVVEADRLGMMRTAAASAVATRWLARPDAQVLGLFGSGWQAEGHLEAIAAVRPLRRVKVFARNAEKLQAFCAKMGERLGIDVVAGGFAIQIVLVLVVVRLGHDGFAVGDRDLVVVRVNFVEGQEAVAVAAVFNKGRLQAGLYAGDLGEIDVAAKLAFGFRLEVELFNLASVHDGDAGFFRVRRIDQHCL